MNRLYTSYETIKDVRPLIETACLRIVCDNIIAVPMSELTEALFIITTH